MPEFKTFKELEMYLQDKIDSALLDEVAAGIKEVEQRAIQDVVYGSYDPSTYSRRETHGGLADKNNMEESLVTQGELWVENYTPFNEGYDTLNHGFGLDELVEYGDYSSGYCYDYPWAIYQEPTFIYPRPFTQETVDRLRVSKEHLDQLWAGLRRRGIHAK